MKYLLDTNTCIQYLNGRSPGVKARLAACADTDIAVCSIVKGELYFGAAKSRDPATAKTKQDTFCPALFPFRSTTLRPIPTEKFVRCLQKPAN